MRGVPPVVLQPVQVLVPLTANLTPVRLVLVKIGTRRIWGVGPRVNYRKRTVRIGPQLLVLVAVQPVVLQPVLVLVVLIAANHRTLKRPVLISFGHIQPAGRIVNAYILHFLIWSICKTAETVVFLLAVLLRSRVAKPVVPGGDVTLGGAWVFVQKGLARWYLVPRVAAGLVPGGATTAPRCPPDRCPGRGSGRRPSGQAAPEERGPAQRRAHLVAVVHQWEPTPEERPRSPRCVLELELFLQAHRRLPRSQRGHLIERKLVDLHLCVLPVVV